MVRTYGELGSLAPEWNRLALQAGTPFMTHEWLRSWCNAFARGNSRWLVLQDDDGSMRAGACVLRTRSGKLCSAMNVHSADWDVLASDPQSRAELWSALLGEGASRVELQGMRADTDSDRHVCRELERAGYQTVRLEGPFCPWLSLPSDFEQLLAGTSSSLRAQVRRRGRMLEREGTLTFRTTSGGPALEADLETFLALEASGWKGSKGTAILSKRSTESLYREFARAAADQGWLRLYFLEIDGEAIAADFGCAYAGTGVFLKTGFNEDYSRLSPGLVLRAEVLRASIEEGLRGYDFLGDPDTYKTRWTADVRPRVGIWAYRHEALPGYLYRKRLRPLLKSARDRVRSAAERLPQRSTWAHNS